MLVFLWFQKAFQNSSSCTTIPKEIGCGALDERMVCCHFENLFTLNKSVYETGYDTRREKQLYLGNEPQRENAAPALEKMYVLSNIPVLYTKGGSSLQIGLRAMEAKKQNEIISVLTRAHPTSIRFKAGVTCDGEERDDQCVY